MSEVIWLAVLFGGGAALSVGPVFVAILRESVAHGFGAGLRVIMGAATADVVVALPALAFTGVVASITRATGWISLAGAVFLTYLAIMAVRDARRRWRGVPPAGGDGWGFATGLLANLTNPLSWIFWMSTGTPTMLRAQGAAGWPGLIAFTVVWFAVAVGIEAGLALVAAASRRRVGARGQAVLTFVSGLLFLALAGTLISQNVLGARAGG